MIVRRKHPRRAHQAGLRMHVNGFTLVEAIMSTLIVSILLVAAVRATGSSALAQYKAAERSTARFLADGLMSEILATSYEDPTNTPAFGRETGESTSSKANYNDVDDFDGWTESPPQSIDGTAIGNMTSWKRSVSVVRIDSANPATAVSSESGAKRITITITRNGVPVLTRVAIKTNAS